MVDSSDCPELEGEKDSLALLDEILGCSCMDEGDLSPDWKTLFGDNREASSSSPAAEEPEPEEKSFLPSQLLDYSFTADLCPSAGRTGLGFLWKPWKP